MIKLSTLEQQTLLAWEDVHADFGYLNFRGVAQRCTTPQHQIRRVVRALARKSMLQFGRGLFTDEGEVAGSGYGLTQAGRNYLDAFTGTS